MNLPCPVHEGRSAHRGCYLCRRPICRLCEVRMRGHLYCSTRCARDQSRNALWHAVRIVLGRPVPARLALYAVAIGAAAPMLFALRAVAELDRLASWGVPGAGRRSPPARIDRVERSPGGASIEGAAPSGAAVFLFGGPGFLTAVPARDGRFRFDDVRAEGPYRVGALGLSAPVPSPRGTAVGPEPTPAELFPAAAAEASVRSVAAPVTFAVPDLTRGPTDRREIALTFDAGSSISGAAEILHALASRGIRTTFFLTGEFIRRQPEVARRIARDGHEAGNHTDSHPHLTTYAEDGRQATRPEVTRAYLDAQLDATARAWEAATGRTLSPIWRAPFGEHNAQIRRWAAMQGYWHVGWTGGRAGLDGLDWVRDPRSRSYRSAAGVVAKLVRRAENGGIILLHLGSDREDPVAPRIPELLEGLAARGFRFARASEFLERAGLTRERLLALASGGRDSAP